MKYRAFVLNFTLIAATALTTYVVAPLITGVTTAQQPAPQVRVDNEYQAGATLYMQKAAEYRALAYQAFNWARIVLDNDEKTKKKLPKAERRKPRAVVVDIDETVLDNSPSQADGIKKREAFSSAGWYAWGEMRKAKAIPGSVEFLNHTISKGVKVYFVSNRDEVQKAATMDNLKKVGFQGVTNETVMLRQNGVSTKEPRRNEILKTHRIVILMGDNLDDMSDVFERKSVADRFAETDKVRAMWGNKFIALPNAMYGTWESAIYEYARLSDAQKAEKRSLALELP
jgi:5'-nucleotidase (lipoprotein e(P4) family)